ncbi:MAG TPA: isochorismatase family protein [Thermoanaerobaculia bacterium]|nr:isochorismatase family protein [Thermoanaerobaculia bacterium]
MTKLDRNNAILVVIDVQEKLMPVIDAANDVLANIERLIRGMHILGVPAVVTEQYVKGLGPTVEPVRRALEETIGYRPLEKSCFSAHGCEPFAAQLAALERRQVLVAGVEAHVCVYQTVRDLQAAEYDVTILADAVSSRSPHNKEIALRRMTSDGVKLSSTEMALFELMVVSGTDEFRAISRLVR